jgi:eukaryotic-like serine/threonine-protein kinase
VITLVLLHPLQGTPVQTWTFQDESVIRLGRAHDNNVVLLSAVVSRHHVEVKRNGNEWEVINLGTNGTYIEGKRVDKVTVEDGMTIRLARSGPKIQINLTVHNIPKVIPPTQAQPTATTDANPANSTSVYPLSES